MRHEAIAGSTRAKGSVRTLSQQEELPLLRDHLLKSGFPLVVRPRENHAAERLVASEDNAVWNSGRRAGHLQRNTVLDPEVRPPTRLLGRKDLRKRRESRLQRVLRERLVEVYGL